jgi:hypothetical protein
MINSGSLVTSGRMHAIAMAPDGSWLAEFLYIDHDARRHQVTVDEQGRKCDVIGSLRLGIFYFD